MREIIKEVYFCKVDGEEYYIVEHTDYTVNVYKVCGNQRVKLEAAEADIIWNKFRLQ